MLQDENQITSSNFINRTNYFGQTALYLAVKFGFTQIVQKLIIKTKKNKSLIDNFLY